MLQNVHLMPKYLYELEKKLNHFATEGSNPNFRLFLTSDPSREIPIGLLEKSIKLTNEPPQGLKDNMKRSFSFFKKEEIEDKDPKIKTIIFGLCYFHSVMCERRKFGTKGWNRVYPFSMGDLRDSSIVLQNYMETNQASGKIPWDDLKYIFGEIMYGGHIVDDWDRRFCQLSSMFSCKTLFLMRLKCSPSSKVRISHSSAQLLFHTRTTLSTLKLSYHQKPHLPMVCIPMLKSTSEQSNARTCSKSWSTCSLRVVVAAVAPLRTPKSRSTSIWYSTRSVLKVSR